MEKHSSLGHVRAARAGWMIRDFPVATYSLIALNFVLYAGSLWGDLTDLSIRYGLIPIQLQFRSLFTAIFLHIDAAHLAINIIFLWLFGRKLERAIGPIEFLLFYIGSGFAASLLHVAITYAFLSSMKNVPVVGASGAISGVLGMYAVQFRRDRLIVGRFQMPAVVLLLAWLLMQAALAVIGLFYSAIGPIDVRHVGYWSHIGGFVFGMTAAWVTSMREENGRVLTGKQSRNLRRQTLLDVAHRFEGLAASDPGDPFAYSELGRVWSLLGDQASSIASYLGALELYRRQGRRAEALDSLREALHFWPETTLPKDTVFRFASYFEAFGEYEDAANHFAWLADVAQSTSEGEMSLLKLGQIELDRLNRPHRAIEALDRLLKSYPDSRWADLAQQLLDRAKDGR